MKTIAALWHSLFAPYPFLEYPARVLAVLAFAYLLYFIGRHYILKAIAYVTKRSSVSWDDVLFEKRVFHALIHLIPILVVYTAAPLFPAIETAIRRSMVAFALLVGALFIARLLRSLEAIYERSEFSKGRPIKGFFQIAIIVIYLVTAILMAAVLMGKSPVLILSGLGALSAVLMLIFKDAILGFVASLQMGLSGSVRQGDWISMESRGADGEVIDISLYTVKVRNWDNTITYIPTQKFLDESFTNWRAMQESGARRMVRSVPLDTSSVTMLSADDRTRLTTDPQIGRFVQKVLEETTGETTNLTLFRKAFLSFLREHPRVRSDHALMVRTLEPNHTGLPLQIYLFTNTTVWEEFESIQNELTETTIALLPRFGLRILQMPSGDDVRRVAAR